MIRFIHHFLRWHIHNHAQSQPKFVAFFSFEPIIIILIIIIIIISLFTHSNMSLFADIETGSKAQNNDNE